MKAKQVCGLEISIASLFAPNATYLDPKPYVTPQSLQALLKTQSAGNAGTATGKNKTGEMTGMTGKN